MSTALLTFTHPQAWLRSPALLATAVVVFALALTALNVRTPMSAATSDAKDIPLPFVLCGGAPAASDPMQSAVPRPNVRVVSSESLVQSPGKRVTMVLVDFPPGSHSPAHRHAGSVSVFVVSGTIYSQLGNGPMERFKPGDTFFEAPGVIHTASGSDTAEAAQILAVFVHDEGATLTTYL